MSKPFKVVETYKYTEVVYYNGNGEEEARDRNHDDWLYDASSPQELTEQEIEDWMED